MFRTLLAALMILASGNGFTADQRPEAPETILSSVIANCREFADEDEIPQEELDAYLLECVNAELSDLEYRPVTEL